MKKRLIITFICILGATTVFGDMQSEQVGELAQNGVMGTDANGDSQTTVVDQNGNLKMLQNGADTPKGRMPPQGIHAGPKIQGRIGAPVQNGSGMPLPQSDNKEFPTEVPIENNQTMPPNSINQTPATAGEISPPK